MNTVNKLKTRELTAIVLLLIAIKISDMTAVLLAQDTKNAFWMVPVISFVTILPTVLMMLHLLKKHKDQNLIGVINKTFGKYIGGFVGFIFFAISFAALTIDSRNTIDVLETIYFRESPSMILYAIFMFICVLAAWKGFQVLGSVTYLMLPYLKIAMLLLGVLMVKEVIFLRVFPLFGEGLKTLVWEGVKRASLFTELIILSMAYPSIKDKENYHKGILGGGIFALLELTAFFFLYCTFFDYKSIDKNAYIFHEVTQYISIGGFFTNMETFFMAFWLVASFVRFTIYLYFAAWIFGEVFSIKEFRPLMLPLAFMVVIFGSIPEDAITNVLFLRNYLLTMITPVVLAFPFLVWITAKIKGVFQS
ncbi:GerAB/ArcD/ProY family transporter [Bacillus sp. SCS-153A]|uniref:GerAB/ArcD/ProY family transporter n=1 Tax=Rossellomorea sedimentorum TaxID=3115294 RepID=UPI0039062364